MERPTPTDGELRMLKVLWRRGPSTVREVIEELPDWRVTYTTALKMLQVMAEKGLCRVDRSERSHRYAALVARDATLRGLVSRFVSRAFDGAANELLVHLLDEPLEPADVAALEARLAALKKREDAS